MRLLIGLQGRGRGAREAALAAAAGALAAYSHPGIGLAPLMPGALIALAYWAARADSYWAAARIGFGFGTGIFAVITIGSRDWALVVPVALTLIGTGLYALPQALWAHHAGRRAYGARGFCATAAAWSLMMGLCDVLGFPTKGEGLAAIAGAPLLLGGARLVGSNLVCGVMIAGTVGCGVGLARGSSWRLDRFVAALPPLAASLAMLLVLCAVAHVSAPEASRSIRVGIPQMNVPSSYFTHRQSVPQLTDAFEDVFASQVRQLENIDLLALTETYDGAYPLLLPRVRERFENYARLRHQAVLLTSYLPSDDGGVYNAVGGINALGQLVGVHRKVNLAPFGEVEFEHGSTFTPEPILPGVRIGVLICQESLLPDGPDALTRSGANVLISHTSDISFGSGLLSFEHLALARMRAIETGRAMIWASAGGPSGASDRWGQFVAAGPFRAPAAVQVEVELHDEASPYLTTAWLWRALALGVLVLHALLLARSKVPPARSATTRPGLATARGYLELLLALGFVWAASVGSAAAVEAKNGTPERAKQSALELLHRRERYLGVSSLARFKAQPQQSAAAAVAYFLDQYGQRTTPPEVHLGTTQPELGQLAAELLAHHGLATREVPFDYANPPRIAALVRCNGGEFCVTNSDRAHRIWLFEPTAAAVREVTAAEAMKRLEATALVPGSDPELVTRATSRR